MEQILPSHSQEESALLVPLSQPSGLHNGETISYCYLSQPVCVVFCYTSLNKLI